MKRAARLRAARAWLDEFDGNDVIRSYARWFAVDWPRAIKELRLLGVPLSEARILQLEATLKNRRPRNLRVSLPLADPAAESFEATPEEQDPTSRTPQFPPIEMALDHDTTHHDPDDPPF